MSPRSCACASPAAISPAIVSVLASSSGSPGLEPILERSSGQVLEDHVRPRALAAVVEQPADVRVGERRDRACLALEALPVGPRPEELDGDPAVELEVVSDPDLRHAPGAEPLLEPVAARDRLLHDPE